ncbi:PREDICTED: uncharacterized protein LOC109176023 [Ipomoea nil]|uniref:uncharacterized protein LOC109176023 n=1 Tax=Ipomoea nil TaxID=35883 RepID=UPI000901E676|nr:PREDICTED: uncharacterized protein LOC109176023 [Ipomoea nil]
MEEILEPYAASSSSSTPRNRVGANSDDNTTIVVHKKINFDEELLNYFLRNLSRDRWLSPSEEEELRVHFMENYSVPPDKIQGNNLYKYIIEEHPEEVELKLEEEEEEWCEPIISYTGSRRPRRNRDAQEEAVPFTTLGEEEEEEEGEEEEEEEEWCEPMISYTGYRCPRQNQDAQKK